MTLFTSNSSSFYYYLRYVCHLSTQCKKSKANNWDLFSNFMWIGSIDWKRDNFLFIECFDFIVLFCDEKNPITKQNKAELYILHLLGRIKSRIIYVVTSLLNQLNVLHEMNISFLFDFMEIWNWFVTHHTVYLFNATKNQMDLKIIRKWNNNNNEKTGTKNTCELEQTIKQMILNWPLKIAKWKQHTNTNTPIWRWLFMSALTFFVGSDVNHVVGCSDRTTNYIWIWIWICEHDSIKKNTRIKLKRSSNAYSLWIAQNFNNKWFERLVG